MKKILTIFLLIMIIICFYQISNMYALYKTELEGDATVELGVWSIKVNNTDISSGEQDLSFELNDENFKVLSSGNVADGKIAPGTEMYADLVIDPSNTDVSIIYSISVSADADFGADVGLSRVENVFEKAVADGSAPITNEQVTSEGNVYTGIIPLEKINGGYINKVRFYFTWQNNDDDEGNALDSEIGKQEGLKLSIPIEINLKQYMGETN